MPGNVARIHDSHVMGRLPVMVTVAILALAAVGQAVDGLGSVVLTEWGGSHLNVAWSACAFLAAGLVWLARFWRTPQNAAVLEIGGIVLMATDLLVYVAAVQQQRGLEGNLIPLGLIIAAVINVSGRALILTWKRWLVGKVAASD